MIYRVKRTSSPSDSEEPCEGCIKKSIDIWEVRTCSTAKEFDERFSAREGKWLSKGREHQYSADSYIKRRRENQRVWCIEIKSLEELIAFYEKYGSIVIELDVDYSSVPLLEIYDDHRE